MPDLVFATKGQAAVLRAQEQMKQQAKDLATEFRKDTQEAEKLGRAAVRIYESTKTPQEQMRQRINTLREAIKKGVAPPEAIEALGRLKTKYHETYSAAQKDISKSSEELEKFSKVQDKSFGTSGVMKWGAALGGAVSAAIVTSFKTIRDEQKKLADDAKGALNAEGALAQLADTPAEYRALLGESRGMFAAGVGRDRNEAAETLSDLLNAGISSRGDRAFFGRMRSSGLVNNSGDFAKAAAALRLNLGGNIQDIVNSSFGAGEYSPGSIEQLLIGASRGGTGAKALGIGFDELIGSTAALSAARNSESEGGTLIASLLKSLDKAGGFEGKTLKQSLAEIQQRVAGGENLRGDSLLGGRAEAVDAYRILTGAEGGDIFAKATAAVAVAGQNKAALRKLEMAESADPSLRAARASLRASQARAIAEMDEGTAVNVLEAQAQERIGKINQRGGFSRVLGRALEGGRTGFKIPILDWQVPGLETLIEPEALADWQNQPWIPQIGGGGQSSSQRENGEILQLLRDGKSQQEDQKKIQSDQLRVLSELNDKASEGGIVIGSD